MEYFVNLGENAKVQIIKKNENWVTQVIIDGRVDEEEVLPDLNYSTIGRIIPEVLRYSMLLILPDKEHQIVNELMRQIDSADKSIYMISRFCSVCGTQRKNLSNFCTKCGSPYNDDSKVSKSFQNSFNAQIRALKRITNQFLVFGTTNPNFDEFNDNDSKTLLPIDNLDISAYNEVVKLLFVFFDHSVNMGGDPKPDSLRGFRIFFDKFAELMNNLDDYDQETLIALSLISANFVSDINFDLAWGSDLFNYVNRLYDGLDKSNHSFHGIAMNYFFLIFKQIIPLDEIDKIVDRLLEFYQERPISYNQAKTSFVLLKNIQNISNLDHETSEKVNQIIRSISGSEVSAYINLCQTKEQLDDLSYFARIGRKFSRPYLEMINFDLRIQEIISISGAHSTDAIREMIINVLELMLRLAEIDQDGLKIDFLGKILNQYKN